MKFVKYKSNLALNKLKPTIIALESPILWNIHMAPSGQDAMVEGVMQEILGNWDDLCNETWGPVTRPGQATNLTKHCILRGISSTISFVDYGSPILSS